MNILHVYKDYPPILGGIENHVKVLAEGQAGRGHAVTVLVTNPTGAATTRTVENDVAVIRAGRLATVASTPLTLALPWRLRRLRPDIVHLHFPYPIGEVSQWLLRRGQATVLSYHSDVVRQASILRFYRPLLERVLAFVDAIIIGSPPMRDSAYLAEHQAKLRLIPYGIPLNRFQAQPPKAELARVRSQSVDAAALAASPAPLLLFVGRLRYYKGLDTLIRALPQIPARLLVVGAGPMAEPWQTLARAVGVADRIDWLGEVPDADLPALYHLADLFVLPASHPSEAFGLVQVEAMAAGLPVVCTELGTGDPGALTSAIAELLADSALRAKMGAAAQLRAGEFDLDLMVDRVMALYGELVV